MAPSVTPWRYKLSNGAIGPPHNPAVRLVTYDRDTGRHLDIEQLRLDLPASNTQPGAASSSRLSSFTEARTQGWRGRGSGVGGGGGGWGVGGEGREGERRRKRVRERN